MTQREINFVCHYHSELVEAMHSEFPVPGPAFLWLEEHKVSPLLLQVFEYAVQESDPDRLHQTAEESLPAFQAPWSSKDEFESRVNALLEIFPKMKSIGSACP